MNRTTLRSLASLLVLALVLIFVFLSRERGGEGAQLDAATGAQQAQGPLATAKDTTPAAQGSNTAVEREIAPESAPTSPAPSPADAVLVRVVDCERFEPVAGAEVRWLGREMFLESALGVRFDSGALERQVLATGQRGTSDERGEIWLPRPRTTYLVHASSPGRWGELWVGSHTVEPQELVLGVDGDLRVEVVDSRGAPAADVRVGVRLASDVSGAAPRVTTVTGPDGCATLAHARASLLGASERGALLVQALTSDPTASQQFVAVPPWPSEPVRLVLREGGEALVRVVDRQGVALVDLVDVQLVATLPGLPGSSVSQPASDGEALFGHLPLGASLTCFAFPRGVSLWRAEGKQFVGPTKLGERVEIEISVGDPGEFVRGRAVAADGQPLANAELALSLRESSQIPLGDADLQTRTDEEGRFEITVKRERFSTANGPRVVLLRAVETGLEGTASLSGDGAAAGLELGDIRMSLPPLLVSGRVVDHLGAPLPAANVSVAHFWTMTQTQGGDRRQEDVELHGQGAIEWEEDRLRSTRTDSEGRFQVRALEPAGSWRIRAVASGIGSGQWTDFANGAEDIELVVRRQPTPLRGRVIVGSPGALGRLYVNAGQQAASFDSLGRFQLQRNSDEPVDVEIRAHGSAPGALETIRAVTDPRDPRLAAIDLRARLRELSFRVVDSNGDLLPRVSVKLRLQSAQDWGFDSSGYVTVLGDERSLDLELRADGHLKAEFDGVRDGDVLTLARAPALLVRVPEHLPAAGAGFEYRVQANGADGHPQITRIEAGRTARLALKGPGNVRVLWTVRGSGKLLSQVDLVVGKTDVECVLDAKLGDVEAARAEALEKAQARARKSVK